MVKFVFLYIKAMLKGQCLQFKVIFFYRLQRGRHDCDHMVVGFTTAYAISAYHH